MERILSVEQMRNADKFTIENIGIAEDVLIQRAGKCVADEITNRFLGGRVLVCVGKGNNGKDGRVVADILSKKHGFNVTVLSISHGILKLLDKNYIDFILDITGFGYEYRIQTYVVALAPAFYQLGYFILKPSTVEGQAQRIW